MSRFVTRWRVRAGYPLAILFWLLARPTYRSMVIGAAIAILGLFVRATAAGHLRKSEALTTTGPYAWTRNPLYFGSTLMAAGFAMASHSWWSALVIAAYFCVFYPAVMRNEEAELRQRYGDAFIGYVQRVPLFFPLPPKDRSSSGNGAASFSWAQYRRNREYEAALGAFGALLLVWVRMKMRH
jgi:protein-S-isoprenylcysteine O-methyltransferase Ste14